VRFSLGVAIVSSIVVLVTLAIKGPAWLNVDSVLTEPRAFYALFAFPVLLAVGGVITALVPRTVSINLAVLAGLLVLAETAAWALKPAPPFDSEPQAIGAPTFYTPDPALGYGLAPSVTARHWTMEGKRVIYDVIYRTDEHGRRLTPMSHDTPVESFVLFFGDSNTFGQGLAQTETLPYYAAEQSTGYRAYNYGVPGYGPAQFLGLARQGRLGQEVAERDGYAVFFLIPAHVGRVVGSSQVSTRWGRHFAYYTVDDRGNVVTHGDFAHGRPVTTLAYFFWSKSNLPERFGVALPVGYAADDYRLTARLLAESGAEVGRQLHLRGYFVILGPPSNDAELHVIEELRDALVREHVDVLDYTRLFDRREARYRLSDLDRHHSALANRVMAARLVSDLGIGR
jgi:hypothetical protein